jgi:DNA-binding response OmpR family regulator
MAREEEIMESARLLCGHKILVVDDSKDMTSLLADVFAEAGARVTEANRGEDAMSFIARGEFDVIFLDLTMPHPDGWKVLQFIRNAYPHMLSRTIVLTGQRYDQEAVDSLGDGHIACMFKPFLLTDLVSRACGVVASVGQPITA